MYTNNKFKKKARMLEMKIYSQLDSRYFKNLIAKKDRNKVPVQLKKKLSGKVF